MPVRGVVRHMRYLPRRFRGAGRAPSGQGLHLVFDVDNFPTLLIQHQDTVAFFGTMLPDAALADRLVKAQAAQSEAELARLATSTDERRSWQRDCNLRALLDAAA